MDTLNIVTYLSTLFCSLLCTPGGWPIGTTQLAPVTSSWFYPMRNKGKELGQGTCSESYLPPNPHPLSILLPLSIWLPLGSWHPWTKCHSSYQMAFPLSFLDIYFPLSWPYHLEPHGGKSSCHLLHRRTEFFSISLNCHTLWKTLF